MQNLDREALRDRAFEEIDRVLANSRPRLTYQDISKALGRNHAFLTTFKNNPDRYMLSLEDLFKLNYLYGVDEVYILKGARFQALQSKVHQLQTLLNSF